MTRREEIIEEAEKHMYDWGVDVDRFDVPDIFTEGAKWADKTMIDKTCEWLQNQDMFEYIGVLYSDVCNISFANDKLVEIFRKAMEE